MSTYTYNGSKGEDIIKLSTFFELNPAYTSFVLNGESGDDTLHADAERVSTLNGGDGDDLFDTYGDANVNMNGGSGSDQFHIVWLENNVVIKITGGSGNDSVIIGSNHSNVGNNGLMLRQSQDPIFTRGQDGTWITLQDTDTGGGADVFIEDSVEFISFFDEIGNDYSYATEEIAAGIIAKKPSDEITSTIDWWPPASGSKVEVPVDKHWANKLWKMSDKDGIINVHIDKTGSFKKKSKRLLVKHSDFFDDILGEISDATGQDVNYVSAKDADILIHSSGKKANTSKKRNYFDVNIGNNSKGKLNDLKKESIATHILYCFGLEDISKKVDHDGDDSLMSYWYSENGYNGLTSSDITALQSVW